jgi:hypothetical protein
VAHGDVDGQIVEFAHRRFATGEGMEIGETLSAGDDAEPRVAGGEGAEEIGHVGSRILRAPSNSNCCITAAIGSYLVHSGAASHR